jgi:hypothetical protein
MNNPEIRIDGQYWHDKEGQVHRIDGPAIELLDGSKSWYINGMKIVCENNEQFLEIVSMNKFDNPIIDENNNKRWYNDKRQLHREDGPAVEYIEGAKWWYINDQRHRLDGPAIVWTDTDYQYYQNDKLHRLDGPAISWYDGTKEWYINGNEIFCKDNEEFLRIVKITSLL